LLLNPSLPASLDVLPNFRDVHFLDGCTGK
jgi:hypothetical protein